MMQKTKLDLGLIVCPVVAIMVGLAVVFISARVMNWLLPTTWSRELALLLAIPMGYLVYHASLWLGMIAYVLTFRLITGVWRAPHQTNQSQ